MNRSETATPPLRALARRALAALATILLAATLAVRAAPPCSAATLAQLDELSVADRTSLHAAYEASRHRIFAADGAHEARCASQRYRTHFDERGFTVTSDAGDWEFGLEPTGFGRDDALVPALARRAREVQGGRLEATWSDGLVEWYVNGVRGLEHGFDLAHPPSGGGQVVLLLAVRGGLTAEISDDERTAVLRDAAGTALARYAGLLVVDALDRELPARLAATDAGLEIRIDDADARYPLTIDPLVEQAKLGNAQQSGWGVFDMFGSGVAVSGDTVVIGAMLEDGDSSGVNGNQASNGAVDSGAAYVFVRDGSAWTEQAYLKASNTGVGDRFGSSVGISGDTIVVGASREGSNATGVDGDETDDTAFEAGAAYVFVRSGTTWSQQAYLKASNAQPFSRFGWSVDMSDDTIVVGANLASAAYVFVRTGTAWSEQAHLQASNSDAGDFFGTAVAICGDTIVVSATGEDSNATGVDGDESDNSAEKSGAAYIFVRSGATWSQQSYLKASNPSQYDEFGGSVSVSGDVVVVGAAYEDGSATGVNGLQDDGASNAGAAYVFVRSGANWGLRAYLKASNTDAQDWFGNSVAVFGSTILVGAPNEWGPSSGIDGPQGNAVWAQLSGAAYVFERQGSTWSQVAYVKASDASASSYFGTNVAIAGDTFVVSGVDPTQEYGQAYTFDLDHWEVIPGCHGNTATYVEPMLPARVGTTVPVELHGSVVSEGLVATYYGSRSVDASGCGVQLSATEELLLALAPAPTFYGLSTMTSGGATMPLSVPNAPGLLDLKVTLQSVVVDTTTFAREFSNGLEFRILP
jgi:hypothetical protein